MKIETKEPRGQDEGDERSCIIVCMQGQARRTLDPSRTASGAMKSSGKERGAVAEDGDAWKESGQ